MDLKGVVKGFCEKLLESYGFKGEVSVEETIDGEQTVLNVVVRGDDLSLLIGYRGKNLESLQHILSQVLFKETEQRVVVSCDINGYREKKQKNIESIAMKAAQQAIEYKVEVALNPMSAAERRIVHIALANDPRITTESEGVGLNRQVIIKPAQV